MSSNAEYLVVGHFKYVDDVLKAIDTVKEKEVKDYNVYSPFPDHHVEDHAFVGKPPSRIRTITLFGGIFGCLGAFLMTTWMSVDYPLRTSAKPLMSFPAFFIIAFECTILIGAIVTLLSMFHFCRIPNPFSTPGYRPEFSNGTYGMVVRVKKDEMDSMKSMLEGYGAHKIEEEYVR